MILRLHLSIQARFDAAEKNVGVSASLEGVRNPMLQEQCCRAGPTVEMAQQV